MRSVALHPNESDAGGELPLVIPPGVPTRDGMYVCGHCGRVNEPSQREIDVAESSPAGSRMELKCTYCHRRSVTWHKPSPAKQPKPAPAPLSPERGAELFRQFFHKSPVLPEVNE